MSEEESGADKPYEATQRKLEDARKRGEIARSQDALSMVHLAGFLVALYLLFGTVLWPLTLDILRHVEMGFERDLKQGFDGDLTQSMLWIIKIASLVFLVPLSLIIAALLATRQIVFAGEKLHLKLNRISPIANFKKKFGIAGLAEFFKSLAKVSVFAVILWIWFRDTTRRFDFSVRLEDGAMLAHLLEVCLAWLWHVFAVYVVFSGIDILWQRHQHAQKNRMSHKEMKDEHKNEEGDESVRAQRRARAQEIATNRMLVEVPQSTVVIVNPTHYAVALKWTGGMSEVPKCVAKGVDETAFRIREIAVASGVPIYSDPPTARKLHATLKIGAEIKVDHYKAVAIAIGHARRIQKLARQR